MTLLDTTIHPYDTDSLLDWIILSWNDSPGSRLHILTQKGDGHSLDKRIRVKLSRIRTALKRRSTLGVQQFGIHSTVTPWVRLSDGKSLDALILVRVVHMRHVVSNVFDGI